MSTLYDHNQMKAMLRAGAAHMGTHAAAAALHLLEFCDIPPGVVSKYVDVEELTGVDGSQVTCAFISDWPALMNGYRPHLNGGAEALLTVAAALDSGKAVHIEQWFPRTGGHAYAKALIEAVAIATGYSEWYTIVPGGKLAEHQRFTQELDGSADDDTSRREAEAAEAMRWEPAAGGQDPHDPAAPWGVTASGVEIPERYPGGNPWVPDTEVN